MPWRVEYKGPTDDVSNPDVLDPAELHRSLPGIVSLTDRIAHGDEALLEVWLRHHPAEQSADRRAGQGVDPRAAPRGSRRRHRARVLRRPVEQQAEGRLRLRARGPAAVPLGKQVRVRHRLAVVL